MAKKKGARPARPGRKVPAKPPDQPTPADQQEHRQAVVEQVQLRDANLRKRPEEMRLDMMRSIITEPLLSLVQEKAKAGEMTARFDVILAINEFFSGGPQRAVEHIKMRSDQWGVKYATVSHYVFACLTVEQILFLADEARALFEEYGKAGSVIYRIWEDTEIDVTVNKSLATVKASSGLYSIPVSRGTIHISPKRTRRLGPSTAWA